MLVPLIAGGALVVVLGVGGIWWFSSKGAKPAPQQTAALPVSPASAAPAVPAAPSGTLLVQGSTDGISVFVDGPIKGFTQSDGTL